MQNFSDYNPPVSTGYKLWFISYVSEPSVMFYVISIHFKVYTNMFNENIYKLAVRVKI